MVTLLLLSACWSVMLGAAVSCPEALAGQRRSCFMMRSRDLATILMTA